MFSSFKMWKEYKKHPIFLASLSYALLYYTVLAPGGVMTAFLTSVDVPPSIIGVYLGVSALIGLFGTFCIPFIIKQFGLEKSGWLMVISQFILLIFATFTLYLFDLKNIVFNDHFHADMSHHHSIAGEKIYLIYYFLALVAASRFFLWSFDIISRQITQTKTNDHQRGVMSGIESSIANLATLAASLSCVMLHHPSQFIVLALFSLVSVGSSAALYSFWFFSNKNSFVKKKK